MSTSENKIDVTLQFFKNRKHILGQIVFESINLKSKELKQNQKQLICSEFTQSFNCNTQIESNHSIATRKLKVKETNQIICRL